MLGEAWGPRQSDVGYLGDRRNRVTMIVPLNLHSANNLPACSPESSSVGTGLPWGGGQKLCTACPLTGGC